MIAFLCIALLYASLAIIGAAAGSVVNLAVYRLAWHQRSYSPWSAPLETAPPRHWSDRIPIYGWFGLRREASLHGKWFWVRPMLVEFVMAAGAVALYWWEVKEGGLIRPMVAWPPTWVLQTHFGIHAFLLALMFAGSLIDVDEKTIPDGITVPGTLVGLLLAAACPQGLLPDVDRANATWDFLRLSSPNPWPPELAGWMGLAIALACWWGWCFALMPRTWYGRHGWRRALGLSLARLRRDGATYRAIAMGVLGALLILAVWRFGNENWQGLLTSLVGMAAGGGIIWAVRIVGSVALQKEAMGFGDVTLMAMIGAFLGWQACLIIFLLSPFAGLVAGFFSVVLHRQPEIPYGPFLCAAAAVVMVWWSPIWFKTDEFFRMVSLLMGIIGTGLALMAGMLGLWRVIRG